MAREAERGLTLEERDEGQEEVSDGRESSEGASTHTTERERPHTHTEEPKGEGER